MTVPAQTTLFNESTANGVTTSFPYEFMIASSDDIAVELDGVLTTTGFTVTGVGDEVGGAVVFSVAPSSGVKVLRYLDPVLSRETDYPTLGDFPAPVVNLDFNRIWLAIQSMQARLVRAIKLPVATAEDQVINSDAVERANKGIKFGADGNLVLTTYDPDAAQSASADAATYASQASASAADALSHANDAEASAAASAASVDALTDDLASTDDGKGAELVSFNDPLAPTYLKTLSDIANGSEVSLFRFVSPTKHSSIRAGTDTSDLLTSFQDAAAAAKAIFIPWGAYYVSGTTNISKDGAKWRGEGISGSKIIGTVNNLPLFTIASGLNGVTLEEFQLSRNVTAITGGDGIKSSTGSIGQATIRRLLIEKQNNGLSLGPTDWSEVEKIIIQKCQNVGVFVTNTATDGACQWSFDSVLSQMNGGQGFMVQTAAGPAQMTVGTFKSCATFANSAVGMAFIGSSGVPLQGVRIIGGFIGEDANHEIYLDTYGDQHVIDGTFIELAGSRTTGPTLSTAASSVGCGVAVTANNTGVQLTGVHSNGNSQDGFFLNGVTHLLGNCRATNNGIALGSGRRNGVYSTAGRVIITGGRYGNTGAGTSQQYGAYVNDGNNLSIGFADLNGNSSAAWSAAANTAYVTSIGNLPNNLNVGLSPAGAVLVGAGATGGFTAAGTINVAGGLLKNNTAYSNP